MTRNVARITVPTGKQPMYDNSGSYYFYDGTPDGPPLPEYQPYRGFTRNYTNIYINGIEVTGEIYEDGSPTANFNGPMEGSLMILWLVMRSGNRSDLGQWTQISAIDYNGLIDNPQAYNSPTGYIPNIGGWTKFSETPNPTGPRVVGYYRIATRTEARSRVLWRIQTAPTGKSVISNAFCWMIRPQWFREPFNPVTNHRVLQSGRSFRTPGITTPSTPDVDATGSGWAGGNCIMCAQILVGSYQFSQDYLIDTPGRVGTENYGGFTYGALNPPYLSRYSFLMTYGLGDNRVLPDGQNHTQVANAPDIAYAGTTIAFPSPPNVQLPVATTPISSVQNPFEAGDIYQYFDVFGSGVPTLVS